jgi:transcriptional regulator with XRE-family HTH domain
MALSRALRIARACRTVKATAQASGTAPSILATTERGLSKTLRLDTLFKLARGYRVPWLERVAVIVIQATLEA